MNFLVFYHLQRRNGLSGSYSSDSHKSLYASKCSFSSSFDVTRVENFTALHVASHAGHDDVVETLLSKYHVRTNYLLAARKLWLVNMDKHYKF